MSNECCGCIGLEVNTAVVEWWAFAFWGPVIFFLQIHCHVFSTVSAIQQDEKT